MNKSKNIKQIQPKRNDTKRAQDTTILRVNGGE